MIVAVPFRTNGVPCLSHCFDAARGTTSRAIPPQPMFPLISTDYGPPPPSFPDFNPTRTAVSSPSILISGRAATPPPPAFLPNSTPGGGYSPPSPLFPPNCFRCNWGGSSFRFCSQCLSANRRQLGGLCLYIIERRRKPVPLLQNFIYLYCIYTVY